MLFVKAPVLLFALSRRPERKPRTTVFDVTAKCHDDAAQPFQEIDVVDTGMGGDIVDRAFYLTIELFDRRGERFQLHAYSFEFLFDSRFLGVNGRYGLVDLRASDDGAKRLSLGICLDRGLWGFKISAGRSAEERGECVACNFSNHVFGDTFPHTSSQISEGFQDAVVGVYLLFLRTGWI